MHTSEDKEVPLRAESNKVRDQWMQKITKATLEYVTTKKKMDREKEEQCKPQLAVASYISGPSMFSTSHVERHGKAWVRG